MFSERQFDMKRTTGLPNTMAVAIHAAIAAVATSITLAAHAAAPPLGSADRAIHDAIAGQRDSVAASLLASDPANAAMDSFAALAADRRPDAGPANYADWSGYKSKGGGNGDGVDRGHDGHRIDSWDDRGGHHGIGDDGHTPPIPEPQSYVLILGGLAVLAYAVRRRRGIPPANAG
jgi:hypothetical protein